MCFGLIELMMELGRVFECHISYAVWTFYCEFLAMLSQCPENIEGHAEISRTFAR
jgi:hypothetical protein